MSAPHAPVPRLPGASRAPLAPWQWAWIALAVVTLMPVAYHAYLSIEETRRELRVHLIQRYSLWETEPNYQGKAESWTRFAAWLLNTEQLLQRVQEKHGQLAAQIGEDFERDSALALSRVVAVYAVAWGAPMALIYAALWFFFARRGTGSGPETTDKRHRERAKAQRKS